MTNARNATVPKFRFPEPVRNLPNHRAGRGGEDRLALRFAQAYALSLTRAGNGAGKVSSALARQIPVHGYGIADVIAVSWRPPPPDPLVVLSPDAFLSQAKTVVCAFEVKLRDWRKALMQANRYRFFAHVATVVLPEAACRAALKFLDTFHLLDVGLWAFDDQSRRITAHFTPPPTPPLDTRRALSALNRVARITKALPIS